MKQCEYAWESAMPALFGHCHQLFGDDELVARIVLFPLPNHQHRLPSVQRSEAQRVVIKSTRVYFMESGCFV